MKEYNIRRAVTGRMQEQVHEYKTEDLFALRAECELLLNLNDGQLAQLDPDLWTRIRNFFSGKDRKNKENIMITQHQVMKLYNAIFEVLISRQMTLEEIMVQTQEYVLQLQMKEPDDFNELRESVIILAENQGVEIPLKKAIADAPPKYTLPEENSLLLTIAVDEETDTSTEEMPEAAGNPHKLLKLTPEGWILFEEGESQQEQFDRTVNAKRIRKHLMPETVTSILKLSKADIVVTSRGFMEQCDEAARELLSSCICMTIADYNMYFWFRSCQESDKAGKAVAMIEFYDRYMYVSGYLVSEDGSDYERLFSDQKIYYSRAYWKIISDIQKREEFAALGLPPESILIHRTFHDGDFLDHDLDKANATHVMPAWETLLRDDFTETVEDLLAKSPLIQV